MNRHLYRVIFNKKRGQMVVVSENTPKEGKSAADQAGAVGGGEAHREADPSPRRFPGLRLKTFDFGLMVLFGGALILAPAAQAEGITTDKTAPASQQPTVLQTSNGLPQVNIQTPTAAGVSMNQYTSFDVPTQGAILNNSRTNVQTQQGGWIQGNPWLANGGARVIVNQVNSTNPSQLNGYVEVAGQRAQVIVANPAGIQVNGGGFINSAGTTLTTGAPVLQNGNLEGFRVGAGSIQVTGKGLDDSRSDYTHLLSTATQVNAGIWAKDLKVAAGHYNVSADAATITPEVNGAAPTAGVAIDTGALGGMYAGKITLMGTDKGLGVNNAGQVFAGSGGLTLSADGALTNSGSLVSSDANDPLHATLSVNTDSIHNSGVLSSQGKAGLTANSIASSGTLHSSDELNVRTQSLNNSGELSGARLDIVADTVANTGRLIQTGAEALAVQAQRFGNLEGAGFGLDSPSTVGANSGTPATGNTAPAGGNASANTSTGPSPSTGPGANLGTSVSVTPVVYAPGQILATDLTNQGVQASINANGPLSLSATDQISNSGHLNLDALTSSAVDFNNDQGVITLRQGLNLETQHFSNQGGSIETGADLHIRTRNFNNQSGALQSSGEASIQTEEANNRSGQINANRVNLASQEWDNTQGRVVAGQIDAAANRIDNTSGVFSANQLTLVAQASGASDSLNNTQGLLSGATGLSLTNAGTTNNAQGQILGQAVAIEDKGFNNQGGLVSSQGALALVSGDVNNSQGRLEAGGELSVQAGSLNNTAGSIQAAQTVTVHAPRLSNAQGLVSAGSDLTLAVDSLNNAQGKLQSGRDVALTGQSVVNASGSVEALGNVAVQTSLLDNRAGALVANQNLTVNAQDIQNQTGEFSGANALVNSQMLNNQGGSIVAAHQLGVSSQTLENQSGVLAAQDNVSVRAHTVNNTDGAVQSQGAMALISNTWQGGGWVTATGPLNVTAAHLDNSAGRIVSQDSVLIHTEDLTNASGQIQTGRNLDMQVAQTLNNRQGRIEAVEDLSLTAQALINNEGSIAANTASLRVQSLDNTAGRLTAAGALALEATGAVHNQGIVAANESVRLSALSWDNENGLISSGQNLSLSTGELNNHQGQVLATDATLKTQDLNNDAGLISAQQGLFAQTQTLSNQSGGIEAGGTMHVQSQDVLNQQGRLQAGGALTLGARDVDNSGGRISANGLSINAQSLHNPTGQVSSGLNTELTIAQLDNRQGAIEAMGEASLHATLLNNQAGRIISNQALTVDAPDLYNQQGVIGAATVRIHGAHVANQGGTLAGGTTLEVTAQELQNATGTLAGGDTTVNAATLVNEAGVIQAQRQLTLTAQTLGNHQGALASGEDSHLQSDTLTNDGGWISAGGNLQANAATLGNQGGRLTAGGNAQITTGSLLSEAGVLSAGQNLTLGAQKIVGSSGVLAAAGNLALNTDVLDTQAGTVWAGQDLQIQANDWNNAHANAVAGHDVSVHTQTLNNQSGLIQGANQINIQSTTLDNTSGALVAANALTLQSDSITNQNGALSAANIDLTATHLNNQSGVITGHEVALHTNELLNQSGWIKSEQLQLESTRVDNTQGQIQAQAALSAHADEFINSQGQVASGHSLELTAGHLDNHSGTLSAGDSVAIHAATLDNSGSASAPSHILAGQDLSLDAQTLNNAGGDIEAGRNMNVSTQGLNNAQGKLIANQDISLAATALDNTSGVISGAQNATLASTEFTNAQGNVVAGQDLNLSAVRLANANGQIQAGHDATLTVAQSLDNRSGKIVANNDLNVSDNRPDHTLNIVNTQGLFSGGRDAALHAQSIGGDGTLQAGRALTLDSATAFQNTGTLSTQDFSLNTLGQFTNTGTLSANGNLAISASSIDNTATGVLEGGNSVSVSATGNVTNRGLINSNGLTRVSGDTIVNTGTGRIYGDEVIVSAREVVNREEATPAGAQAGVIAARNQLTVNADHLVNQEHALLFSGNDMTLAGPQGLATLIENKSATIEALGDMTLSAQTVRNSNEHFSMELVKVGTPQISFSLTPEDSQEHEIPIHYDWDLIKREDVSNGYDYVLKDNIDQGDKFVLGQMPIRSAYVTKAPQVAAGPILGNSPAPSVEAGSSVIHEYSVYTNTDPVWGYMGVTPPAQTKAPTAPLAPRPPVGQDCSMGGMWGPSLACQQYTKDLAQYHQDMAAYATAMQPWVELGQKIDAYNNQLSVPGFGWTDDFIGLTGFRSFRTKAFREYWGTVQEYSDRVKSSDPGKIISSGNLTLNTGLLTNDKSQIVVGQDLLGNVGSISNIDAKGERVDDIQGNFERRTIIHDNWNGGYKTITEPDEKIPFHTIKTQTIDLSIAQVLEHTQTSGATPVITGVNAANGGATAQAGAATQTSQQAVVVNPVSGQALGAGGQASAVRATGAITAPNAQVAATSLTGQANTVSGAGVSGNSTLSYTITTAQGGPTPDLSQAKTVAAPAPTSALPAQLLPNNSLYAIRPDNAQYLVETDPKFANYRQWLSSDYMLQALSIDPGLTHKRLGDGYYEQRLVTDQIVNLTGQRYLDGYSNNENEYKALMDAGVTAARTLNLTPGVALSAEQIARLTSDIVWLQAQTITLSDGSTQNVLVPQVYLMPRSGDLYHNGALIAAQNIDLNLSGDLNNQGTIAGRKIVSIRADNINNLAGHIQGDSVTLAAQKDLNVLGGDISAVTGMNLFAGNNLNVQSSTYHTEVAQPGFGGERTGIDRVAALYVTGPNANLNLAAGKDLSLQGASVTNAGLGTTTLAAGNNLTVGAVQTHFHENGAADARNYVRESQMLDVGSQINTVGDIRLSAQNALTVKASDITSQTGSLSAQAGKTLSIEDGRNQRQYDAGHYLEDSGFFSWVPSKPYPIRLSGDSGAILVQIHL